MLDATEPATTAERRTQRLSVLTFNCWGLPVPVPGLRRRLAAIGRSLAALDLDVVCLQEVGRWRHLTLLRQDGVWPHSVAATYPYHPRGGLVTLARLPVIETTYRPFRERGRVASLHATEWYQSKGVLRATLLVGEQPVVVFNTHLAANYNARWGHTDPYARVERLQLRELAEEINGVPQDTPVIVAGDFNVPRRSWLYDEFCAATGVIDPLADSPEPTYRPLPGMPTRAAVALDHLLIRVPPGCALDLQPEFCFREPVLLEHGRYGFLSDHIAVRVVVAWR
ncbi:endonuclease/exonuclease/phosphatase family protein [Kallotenue papyrolyticum]|uniref:endonuclease/exonuclease/phosphatase family protein n=1 Tax=Kallotenue papyrolyticum TaxID=1325125 RepID=UPI0004785BCF|nr:endonuclease/exonuclease/phosphatase family protein [Kallotenue papyrolyticum]